VVEKFADAQFSGFKADLTDLAVEKLGPIGEEMKRLMGDPGYVDGVLRDGAERARAIAEPIQKQVEEIMGFLDP